MCRQTILWLYNACATIVNVVVTNVSQWGIEITVEVHRPTAYVRFNYSWNWNSQPCRKCWSLIPSRRSREETLNFFISCIKQCVLFILEGKTFIFVQVYKVVFRLLTIKKTQLYTSLTVIILEFPHLELFFKTVT